MRRNADLLTILLATAVFAGFAVVPDPLTVLRPLALPLVVFLPGYALLSLLFGTGLPGVLERIVGSIALSLVTVMMVALTLHVLSLTISRESWLIGLSMFVATVAVAGSFRRDRGRQVRMPRLLVPAPRSLVIVFMSLAGALAYVIAAILIARTPLPAPSATGYTALGMVRESGSERIRVEVRSAEFQRVAYVLRVRTGGSSAQAWHFVLDSGDRLHVTLPPADRADAVLRRDGHPAVYRRVHIVTPPAS